MAKKVTPPVDVSTRYSPKRKVNGYGVVYWVVLDGDNDNEAIPGRMLDELAAINVAHLLNTGGERRSCAKI